MLCRVVWYTFTDVSEVLTACTIRAMPLVNVYQNTGNNIPEDSHLHTRRRQNLKSHHEGIIFKRVTQSCHFAFLDNKKNNINNNIQNQNMTSNIFNNL
jgi:hypothetical protein